MVVCRRFGSTLLPAQAWEGQISKEARSRMSEEDERPHLEMKGCSNGSSNERTPRENELERVQGSCRGSKVRK